MHAIVTEPAPTLNGNPTANVLGFAKLSSNVTTNATDLVAPLVRHVTVVGMSPNKPGSLEALFAPTCIPKLPPTGWSKTIRYAQPTTPDKPAQPRA